MIARAASLTALVLALAVAGCHAAAPSVAPSTSSERPDVALAAAAASLLCPAVSGRIFSSATSHGEARDAYAELLACDARAEGETVRAHAVLGAWVAVTIDAAGARVDQYLHATVVVDAAYALSAEYVRGRLAVRLRPLEASRVSVTPLGTVDVESTNWAALALGELARAKGTTPEWLAKDRVRDVAVKMLHEGLDRPLLVCLDVAHDAVAVDCADAASPAAARERVTLWVAPHGAAFLGPFAAGTSRQVAMSVSGALVAARAVCADDLPLARDRRGADVDVDGAPFVAGEIAPPRADCAWGVAARAIDGAARAVTFDIGPPVPAPSIAAHDEGRRWVTVRVDDAAIAPSDAVTELWIESPSGAVRVDAGAPRRFVAELGDGDAMHLRLRGARRGAVVAEAAVPADARGAIEVRAGGAVVARATIEARAVPAPPKGAAP